MKNNTCKLEEEIEADKIELDFDDILVQSVDGLITCGDEYEIKLLFYYIKPESYIGKDGFFEGKGVAELRISCSKFIDIAKEINERLKEIRKEKREMIMFS